MQYNVTYGVKSLIKKMVLSGMFLALCMVLPLLTGQIPQLGNALLPMHFPVILCGFVCGWPYGLAVGLVSPVFRFLLFGMPPIFPTAVAMTFELAVYGLTAGILYRMQPEKMINIYITLISAMLAGRVAWGAVMYVISGLGAAEFSFGVFLSGAFVIAIPGIIGQIILIPLIILAFQKAGLMENGRTFGNIERACEKV